MTKQNTIVAAKSLRGCNPNRIPLVAIILLILAISAIPDPGLPDESTLKAVFLERFCRFVQWPDDSLFADTTKPFVIAVAGDPQMAAVLGRVYRTVHIRGRQVSIVRATADHIPPCRLLFVGPGVASRLPEIVGKLKSRAVLIVGDTPGFARKGVHINMYTNAQQQIRFEVNNAALVGAGLHMSHLLLGLVRVIDPAGGDQ